MATTTGGYHGFEILEGPTDLIKCLYCTGILRDAMELPCGHLVCETCLQDAAENKNTSNFNCPNKSCLHKFTESEVQVSRHGNRLVNDLKVFCLMKKSGCIWSGCLTDYYTIHNEVCKKSKERQSIKDVVKQVKNLEKVFKKEIAEITKELEQVREEREASKKELMLVKTEIKELTGEVSLLNVELNNMEMSNRNLQTDQHNLTNKPPSPSFHLSINVMIAGLERFIEHNRQTIVGPCTDYVKWFAFVFQKVPVNDAICCHYDNYLFMKILLYQKPRNLIWLSCYGEKAKKILVLREAPHWTFQTQTMDDGWSHTNTKFALVLHPTDIGKVREMSKSGFNKSRDEWSSEQGILSDYYSADNELIICCKKISDLYP